MGQIRMTIHKEDVSAMLEAVSEIPGKATAALMAGAQVMLPVVTAAAPVRSDGSHIKNRMGIKQSGGYENATVRVGALDAPIAHLVEQGHGGPHPAPAHPYFVPAVESVEDAAMSAIMEALK